MSEDYVKYYEIDYIQNQIYDIQSTLRNLEMIVEVLSDRLENLQSENTSTSAESNENVPY